MFVRWFLFMIVLAHSAVIPSQQGVQGKILIDIGHTSQDVQAILGDLVRELEINYYTVEFTKTLSDISSYDVVMISAPTQPLTAPEIVSLTQFVSGGGSLLLLGESGVMTSENVKDFDKLSEHYGISFQRDVVVDPVKCMVLDKSYPEIPVIEHFADHPVTRSVAKIFLVSGCSMRLSQKATPLAWGNDSTYGDNLSEVYGFGGGTYDPYYEKKGSDLIVMACCESGRGRVVALGDTSLFRGVSTAGSPWPQAPFNYFDHKRLALNIFRWLSVKSQLGRAQELLAEANSLIEGGNYKEAKDILADVKSLSQETGDLQLMREAATLIAKAERGIEADTHFEEGKQKLKELNCGAATESFQKAASIYEIVGNTKRVQECLDFLSECGSTEALLKKADLLVLDAKKLMGQKKWEEATKRAEEARGIYEALESAEKVEECDSLIAQIHRNEEGEITEEKTQERNRIALAVMLLVTGVVVLALYLQGRSKPERIPPRYRYRRD